MLRATLIRRPRSKGSEFYQPETDFEGFDFRESDDVLFKRVTLDAYYQIDTLPEDAPEAQTILYDDVVIATTRVGCKNE